MSNFLTIMDSVFDDIRPSLYRQASSLTANVPALNIREYNDHYQISIIIAGIEANKIKVELADGILNISYQNEEEKSDNSDNKLIREEFRQYSFTRSVTLPKNVEDHSVKAVSKNGILTISVNKMPEKQPKNIEIESQ